MEKVRPLGWLGIALSIGGVAVISLARPPAAPGAQSATFLGDGLILFGTLLWAGYTLLIRPMMKTCSPTKATAVACLGAIPALMLMGVPQLLTMDWQAVPAGVWGAIVFSGFLSVGLVYIFWNYGVAHLGSTRTALYTNVTPAIAIFTAWIWLDETIMPQHFVGVALVLCGVTLARRHVTPVNDAP
jgi:drug/metabolite transporter (DMT)-like permease